MAASITLMDILGQLLSCYGFLKLYKPLSAERSKILLGNILVALLTESYSALTCYHS